MWWYNIQLTYELTKLELHMWYLRRTSWIRHRLSWSPHHQWHQNLPIKKNEVICINCGLKWPIKELWQPMPGCKGIVCYLHRIPGVVWVRIKLGHLLMKKEQHDGQSQTT